MSIATQVLEKLFENRYNFVAPDSGPHKLPYTCSFHWFYTPEGQLIGVDAVRSDDTNRHRPHSCRCSCRDCSDGRI